MQALSKAAAGKSYTIKWMFGIPEVLDKIRKCKIDEGSEITVIQNSGRDLIIRSGEKRIAMSRESGLSAQVKERWQNQKRQFTVETFTGIHLLQIIL